MATIHIRTIEHSFTFDVINVALLFWPGSKISQNRTKNCTVYICSEVRQKKNSVLCRASVQINRKRFTAQKTVALDTQLLAPIKQTLFRAAQKATGICPPWGILTGIRPMHIFEKLAKENDLIAVDQILAEQFFLQPHKRALLQAIYQARQPAYYPGVGQDVSVYVSIPFCPSKCKYCSFVSSSVERVHHLIEPYICLLISEISAKLTAVRRAGLKIASVYVGGGTPGVLSAEQINVLLTEIGRHIDPITLKEFCFEIGRPETVSAEKLEVLKKHGITRLCINCQSLNDTVLEVIGRRHTAAQFEQAFLLAKDAGFSEINVDFIAGLPGESAESHLSSVRRAIELGAENITVHTLCVKRASTWENREQILDPQSAVVEKMLEDGYKLLNEAGYRPYYIYRQKNTLANGENIGYAKNGKIGLYNIYMMEDVHTVIGCGAGASTKLLRNGRIDRLYNMKYPLDYIEHPEKLEQFHQALSDFLLGGTHEQSGNGR